MSRISELRGTGLDKLFPRDWDSKEPALTAGTPWGMAGGRRDRVSQYDRGLVKDALQNPDRYRVAPMDLDDPNLRSVQPGVTRMGVQHYMGDDYRTHGTLFADKENAGNQKPMVYHRDDGQSLILSGHHRAVAGLLGDQPVDAIHVHGPWGAERRQERPTTHSRISGVPLSREPEVALSH